MKAKVGVLTNTYGKFSLDEALKGSAEAGFKYVELLAIPGTKHIVLEKMGEEEVEKLKEKLKGYGLEPTSVSAHSDLTKKEGVKYIKKAIDFAKSISAGVVNTGAGEADSPEGASAFYENMKELSKYAQEKEIIIGLETHGSILGTGEAGLAVMKRINSDFVRINYDTANVIFYAGVRPEEDIHKIIDYIAHLHLKDKIGGKRVWNFPALGEGEIDFKVIFDALEKKGFSGPMGVEIEFDGTGKETLEEVNQAVKTSYEFLKKFALV